MGDVFYMVEVESSHDDWWVVGILDNSDAAVKMFTQRKGKKDNVHLLKCEVIMEYKR